MPVTPTTDIKSGMITEKVFERDPKGYRVVWINWDSDFRNTDLQTGDLITGVDGKKYENIHDGNISPLAVGQHLESINWQRVGAKDGQETHHSTYCLAGMLLGTSALSVWMFRQICNVSQAELS